MKITNVEAIVLGEPLELIARDSWDGSQDTVLIRVSTDEGIDGIGEVDSAPEVAVSEYLSKSMNEPSKPKTRLIR